MKILIIGGVAGGATAAARLRRISEEAEIIMVEKDEHISYANCGLPYHIGDVIKERERLLLETPESFKTKLNVDVRIKTKAMKIDRTAKKVLLKNLKTNETYEENYDYLLLSPGAKPIKPNIEGIDGFNVFSLRNVPDMDKIKTYIHENNVKNAVVIGGGFIGVEVAENLAHKGLHVSLVEMADQIMTPLDFEMASILHHHISDNKINLYLKDGVKKIQHNKDNSTVHLSSGEALKTNMIIMSTGVKPETTLAKDCGIELGRVGIKVNEYMQTSDQYIYAVGDAVEITNYITKKQMLLPLAGPANRQARIAANNIMLGNKEKYDGVIGTSIIKVFDLTAAATGLNEKILKANSIEYYSSIINSNSNAGYYPGALPMNIKLLFGKDGKIFGAQIVGSKGVDKRIDVFATAIKGNLKVEDLEKVELAYAPPFGSAKDPVNISGYVANNLLKKDIETIHWNEIDKLENTIILDIRTREEQMLGTIDNKNVINIPLDTLRNNLDKLDKNKNIIVFCQYGLRGYLAYRILKLNGFKVQNLDGGFKIYSYATKKISKNIFEETKKEQIDFIVNKENILKLDACGLQCPGPIMETYKKMNSMEEGQVIEITATDPGFKNDISKWAEKTGNKVLEVTQEKGIITAKLIKGSKEKNFDSNTIIKDNKTIVVFSNDLDKALASFVIANGAASMGKKVTLFFTFWGLNILRKENYSANNKNFIEKMFGFMMPKGAKKLKLSKMNFGGIGTSMMKGIMRSKNVDQLEIMMKSAVENGVKLLACQMSMDLMGIKKEELIEGVDIGGVATYLAESEESNLNLFI